MTSTLLTMAALSAVSPSVASPSVVRTDPLEALLERRPGARGTGRTRTAALCAALGDPQRALPAVHVTGTNGKTSTTLFTAALLAAAGRGTGAYVSPHLVDVTERIRINDVPIGTGALRAQLDAVAGHVAALDAAGHGLGFFDVLTAVALRALAVAPVEVAVVEAGRGGRDDATNVLDADVVVLGPVALDHAELGRTPVEVARNKLGLLRPGATLVTAPQRRDVARAVQQVASTLDATIVAVGRDVTLGPTSRLPGGQRVVVRTATDEHVVDLPVHGPHQAENLALAIAAAEAFLGDTLSREVVRAAAARTRVPGRLEEVPRPGAATLLLDGAHNPAAAHRLAEALPNVLAGRPCVAVVGCAADKDVAGVVAPLIEVVDGVVATCVPGGRTAAPQLVAACSGDAVVNPGATVVEAVVVEGVHEAVAAASRLAGPGGVVLVTGSLHLVGAVRGAAIDTAVIDAGV